MIAINLDPALIENVSYADNVLSFTVSEYYAAAVLGVEDANYALSVVIATDGAVIVGIQIEYVIPADDATYVDETKVTIIAEYNYDNQSITIE